MASYTFDAKAGRVRVFFRFGGRQYNKTVKVASERKAEALCATIEETIADLERGRLTLPLGADPKTFIISGGVLAECPSVQAETVRPLTLSDLFERYRGDPPPHLESSTRKMQEIHFRRLLGIFPTTEVRAFDVATAQSYVTRRSRQTYRGRHIQRETIEKELKSLRQAWSWVAARTSDVPPPSFILKDLSFPKEKQKPPFMSWEQIEQEIARGLPPDEVVGLWDCLWLERQQVHGLLEYMREAAAPPFLYPMVCAAAYTGARRSELCRSRRVDWQLDKQVVRFRQKKRDKHKEFSYRDVRLHPRLADVMVGWFARHPGGGHAFCDGEGKGLTVDAATYHFKRAVKGSKWEVVRGWHVLRHSFASNLAQAGKDQRIIDRWMGHSTDVRWRYQHLRPKDEQEAIDVL